MREVVAMTAARNDRQHGQSADDVRDVVNQRPASAARRARRRPASRADRKTTLWFALTNRPIG